MLTYVGAYEDRQVTAAVRRELLRDGQVFYIHNRVQSIEKAAAKIQELVPEARVATAHGQMGEHQLEQVMLDFWEKRFDVLVCTTIVESGLDVSNANTMIIERSDTLGLSQLHQLRGRVGRSPRAGLRLLPLPAGQAADRDRPRAAGHAGPALRPRRRHGDRDEGPRDPRRRQPARRRAVRPHRRRRLRPLRAPGRRGGLGVPPGRRAALEAPHRGQDRAARSTPTCRTTTSGSERLRLEMYKRLAEVRSDDDVAAAPARSCSTATAPRPSRSPGCSRWPASGPAPGDAGLSEVTVAGQVRPLPPRSSCPTRASYASTGCTRRASTRPPCVRCWCRDHAVRLRRAASSRRGAARLGQAGDRRRDRARQWARPGVVSEPVQ